MMMDEIEKLRSWSKNREWKDWYGGGGGSILSKVFMGGNVGGLVVVGVKCEFFRSWVFW